MNFRLPDRCQWLARKCLKRLLWGQQEAVVLAGQEVEAAVLVPIRQSPMQMLTSKNGLITCEESRFHWTTQAMQPALKPLYNYFLV